MQSKPNTVRIVVTDDHAVVRVGLRTLLAPYPHLQIVGEAATSAATMEEVLRLKPDVLLLDVRMPGGSGFEVAREIHKAGLPTRVLFLTSFADDETILEAISSGADGYLLKEITAEELARAVEQVASGQSILDPAVTRRVMGRLKVGAEASPSSKFDLLSAQEQRVIALVAQGKTNKEIGLDLGLSDKTVKNYLSNALDKLQMTRRSQAAAFYVQHCHR
ncbi:MAG: response regulator transcription factor [Pedosphaera parvula]|nr:response regulator transcription factor [Pedosphaera parvula]